MLFSKQISRYESDISRLINELKQKNPQLEQEQRAGRALLWDKAPIDLDQRKRAMESSIDQKPYVYSNK